jgi:RNA polymerase sigma-54 factor
MELSYQKKQTQNQQQKLILSEQMQESLKILQMSCVELQHKIEEELTENPALEYENTDTTSKPDEEDDGLFTGTQKMWENHLAEPYNSFSFGEESPDPFVSVSQDPNFLDFLLRQLSEISIEPSIERVCRYLIESLDERGYLPYDPDEIAHELHLSNASLVRTAVKIMQQMDPAGVCAFDLRECLLLQLKRKNGNSPAVSTIVEQYLEFVADNKIREIARKMNVSMAQAQSYCDIIRNLNPIPSRGFQTGTRELFVIPEAIVYRNEDGKLCIEDYRIDSRRLYINPYYKELVKSTNDRETLVYLNERIQHASSLMLEIAHRKRTFLRILELIVQRQPLCFEKGRSALKPMSMGSVAEELGLHESTVSRAVQNKFILCSFGTVNMKSFFTSGIALGNGSSFLASEAVQLKIKEIIKEEDHASPLSDQQIVAELQQSSGISISRRTVAKYRDELHIPSSSKRKVYS